MYKRSLAIWEKALGPEHLHVGMSLNNLAELYQAAGPLSPRPSRLYKRSLAIREKALGPEHPDVGTSLNNLAVLYDDQGRYAEAEPLYKTQPRHPREGAGARAPGRGQPRSTTWPGYIARQGRYAEAEPLYKRSLAIGEKALGPEHPHVSTSLNNLAELYLAQGRYAEAEAAIQAQPGDPRECTRAEHPDMGTSLNNLAWLGTRAERLGSERPSYWRSSTAVIQRRAERGLAAPKGSASTFETGRFLGPCQGDLLALGGDAVAQAKTRRRRCSRRRSGRKARKPQPRSRRWRRGRQGLASACRARARAAGPGERMAGKGQAAHRRQERGAGEAQG